MHIIMYDVVPRGNIPAEHWNVRNYELYAGTKEGLQNLVLEMSDRVGIRVGYLELPDYLYCSDYFDDLARTFGGERGNFEGVDYVVFPHSTREKVRDMMVKEHFTID